ncbi:MAG: ATP-dependent DNA helicase RecG [Planctomycetaceae bacterium]
MTVVRQRSGRRRRRCARVVEFSSTCRFAGKSLHQCVRVRSGRSTRNRRSDDSESHPVFTRMTDDPLSKPVQFLKGVGPERARILAKLDLVTVGDVLNYLPRDVLDLSELTPIPALREGELQTVRGKVVDMDARDISRGRTLSAVLIESDANYARGVWFNQPWMLKKFRMGEQVLFSGKPKRSAGRWEFAHPYTQWLGDDDTEFAGGGVLPRYGLTEGLRMDEMRRIAREAVQAAADALPETFPESLLQKLELPNIREAVRGLHCPVDKAQYEAGRHRLIFNDLFEFQLGLALRRRSWKSRTHAPSLPTTAKIDARIRRLFPFQLTAGQNEAVREIAADLAREFSMHRLLQADVGAGKTAVALYAMLVAVASGYQAVLMAPTEVLANQHWGTVEQTLTHSRVNRLLLTGNLTAAQRKQARDDIAAARVQLVVGTQAVIQESVRFGKLGLAVIDEQHKFGVLQRAGFASDGLSPHVLVMTATPIPRSLCLTQFGDLDITTISELPPGRQKVSTHRVQSPQTRARSWEFVRKHLERGRQAYVVCPRIEGAVDLSDDSGASAEETYRNLSTGELKDFRVSMVHGQMDRDLRAAVMQSFRNGHVQVLVSTTVIEVGIDVPNATLMIIQQAHQFGLSQLHQLRGRVARGKFQGYCFLFSDSESPEAVSRLWAMEQFSDGFKIAETDFELRGPGDVLGIRQHGQLPLKVADLVRDKEILDEARKRAFALVDSGEFDTSEYAPLKIHVLERFGHLMDLPQTG